MKAGDELDREGVAGTSEVEDIADLFSEFVAPAAPDRGEKVRDAKKRLRGSVSGSI